MNTKIEYKLAGEFKVDLYKGNDFVSSSNYFSNFITPTGLLFPSLYPFADCFRYLSLGSGRAQNSGSNALSTNGTTGLSSGFTGFSASNGVQGSNYINWMGYATGTDLSFCGTSIIESGIRLYRAWQIPTGAGDVSMNHLSNGLLISEFMVSPDSGSNSTGKYAFSRVVKDVFIPNGYRSIITYQLKITTNNTGITFLSGGSFKTGDANTIKDAPLLKTWASLSGYYRQIYHGLRCIDGLGMSYITKLGDGLEPASANQNKMVWYLSPDNSQFDVNPSGGSLSDFERSYKADGLMAPIRNLNLKDVIAYPSYISSLNDLTSFYHNINPSPVSSEPSEAVLSNIRLGSASTELSIPYVVNYRLGTPRLTKYDISYQLSQNINPLPVSFATPGASGYSSLYDNYGSLFALSCLTNDLPMVRTGQNLISGRKKTIKRKSFISPLSSLGYNTRFGSLVYAFENGSDTVGDKTYYPLIDCLFFDTSGRSLMKHYRFITGVQLADRGTGLIGCEFYITGGITPSYLENSIGRFGTFLHRISGFFGPPGPMTDHPIIINAAVAGGASGTLVYGPIDTHSYGSFNAISIPSDAGWGMTYGMRTDNSTLSCFNQGLTDHTVFNLISPSSGDPIYWPDIMAGNEMKAMITGFQYYHPYLTDPAKGGFVTISDPSGWFNSNRQIIRNIEFGINHVTPLESFVSSPTGGPNTNTIGPGQSRYILTTGQFNKQSFSNFDDLESLKNIPGNFKFTGYIIPSGGSQGKLFDMVWTDPTFPSNSFSFIPTFATGLIFNADHNVTVARIQRLFETPTDRGYLSGTGGVPFKVGDIASIFFTGFYNSPTGNIPLYLSYIEDTANQNGTEVFGQYFLYSNLSGAIYFTDFSPPSGTIVLHSEMATPLELKNPPPSGLENFFYTGARLLPSSSTPTNYCGEGTNFNFVSSFSRGGEYPALSLDNGLEIGLDISWSSPCGAAINCNEPI